jgi:hypothetical protein
MRSSTGSVMPIPDAGASDKSRLGDPTVPGIATRLGSLVFRVGVVTLWTYVCVVFLYQHSVVGMRFGAAKVALTWAAGKILIIIAFAWASHAITAVRAPRAALLARRSSLERARQRGGGRPPQKSCHACPGSARNQW